MPKLMIHDGTNLCRWVLLNQCVEQHDFAEVPKARDESI